MVSGHSTVAPDGLRRISYLSLPHRRQLLVLCLARVADPIAISSIKSYLFYQLKWFHPDKTDSQIATCAGVIVATKTLAEVCTSLLWGRLADSDFCGRKIVLLIGLVISGLATIGYGFSTSFPSAVMWQVIGGAFNSNITIIRCVMAELNPERKYRVRAFMLLPLCSNLGFLLGPLLGGFLSLEPGPSGLHRFPYLLPNLVVGLVHLVAALGVGLVLNETLESVRGESARSFLARPWRWAKWKITGGSNHGTPDLISENESQEQEPLLASSSSSKSVEPQPQSANERISFGKIWTRNVIMTLLTLFLVDGHTMTFQSLWALFLSTTPSDSREPVNAIFFTGGIGLRPSAVGLAMSLLGVFGLILQITLGPSLIDRFGIMRIWRSALAYFPLVYTLSPYPAMLVDDSIAMRVLLWGFITLIAGLFVVGRSSVTPATPLLLTDCSPHTSARATVLAAGTMTGNLAQGLFPVVVTHIYGIGLNSGVVGLGFWSLTVVAIAAWWTSRFVKDGPEN